MSIVSETKRSVIHVLPNLLHSLPPGASIRLHAISLTQDTEARIVDKPSLKPVVDEALKLRREYRVPFWEAVLLIARRDSIEVDAVLEAANHHQPMEAFKNIDLVANSVTPETLDGLITSLESNQVLTFSSQITLIDGSTIHIPMLDFRIRPNPENLNLATMIVDHAGLSGHIFDSGNSYHFYGTSTVDGAAGLANFLGKFSLFAPFVDQRWIAHQLIEGACALRISRGKNFAEPPRQVRYVATPGSNRTALGS